MAESIQCYQCGTRMTLAELVKNHEDCQECGATHTLSDVARALELNTRAKLPSQGGEAVAVVHEQHGFCWYEGKKPAPGTKLYTHPAEQVAEGEQDADGDRPGYDALWLWFSMSRSSYAVLPRVMMHDMPDAWQAAFARLMDEWDETWINQPDYGTRVQLTDLDGKLIGTPGWLLNYRHPDREQLDRMRAANAPSQGNKP